MTAFGYFSVLFVFLSSGAAAIGSYSLGRSGFLLYPAAAALSTLFYLFYLGIMKRGGIDSLPKTFSKIIWALFGLSGFVLAGVSSSLALFFITDTTLSRTPRAVVGVMLALTVMILMTGGREDMGRLCSVLFFPILFLALFSLTLAFPRMDFGEILPLFPEGAADRLKSLGTVLLAPFLEGIFPVLLLSRGEKSERRPLLLAPLFSGLFIALIMVKNLTLLSYTLLRTFVYPSYAATSLISMGNFFQRMEVVTSISYVLCLIVKTAVFLSVTKKSMEKTMPGVRLWHFLPFLALWSAVSVFKSSAELSRFAVYYPLAAAVPGLLLPLAAAIKKRRFTTPR